MPTEENVYIVTGSSGSYAEQTEWNVCVVLTEERAVELAGKLNELVKFNNAFAKTMQEHFEHDEHTSKTASRLRYPAKPAYIPGSNQKEHLKRINAWKEEWKIVNEQMSTYMNELEKMKEEYIDTNYLPPPELQEAVQYANQVSPNDRGHCDDKYSYCKCPIER
jgi:hypothetical protein